jgi:hypothetical protein
MIVDECADDSVWFLQLHLECEKQHNPFLVYESFEAFIHLKDTWDTYKAEHGIR